MKMYFLGIECIENTLNMYKIDIVFRNFIIQLVRVDH